MVCRKLLIMPIFNYVKKYIQKGIPVFPQRTRDEYGADGTLYPCKSPLLRGGYKAATTDLYLLEKYWSRYPCSAIGMPTGEVSGLTAIDLDVKGNVNGIIEWERLNREFGTEPYDTTLVITPNKGYHLYYKYCESIKTSCDKLAIGIETKNNGSQITLPPSKNMYGEYKFLNNKKPTEIHNWIIDLLKIKPVVKTYELEVSVETDTIYKYLENISPDCDYYTWVTVGMALHSWSKNAGCVMWDSWSQKGKKYKPGECEKKWRTFSSQGIGIGTLFFLSNKK